MGIVGHWVDHIKVTWRRGRQVAPQVTEDNQSVAKETKSISDQVENALVLLSFLRLRMKTHSVMKQLWTFVTIKSIALLVPVNMKQNRGHAKEHTFNIPIL